MRARAMVQPGPGVLEEREFEVPVIGDGEALLKIEATGICGSDKTQLDGGLAKSGWSAYPVIPGHEPVGRVVEIGAEARRLWGVGEGQLVAVESVVPCQVCDRCTGGLVKFCRNRFSYGFTPTTFGSGLWGGFAEYLVLRPNTRVHPVPDGVEAEVATLFNPLGAGFDWTVRRGGTTAGDAVVVLGCGQRGLACAVAARAAGADRVVVTGLAKDRHKLEIASRLGVDATVEVDNLPDGCPDVVTAVRAALGGDADRVVDTTPHAVSAIGDAIALVRPGGVVVVAGLKGGADLSGVDADAMVLKAIDLRGVVSVEPWGYRQALRLLGSGRLPVELLHSHTVPLAAVREGIELLSRSDAVHVSVVPEVAS
ncbi:zinc-dependent alcohol dehydrogenase [Amycolatopsis solani]|uniref:zinc-dependent alcohol dehydrogenase n=1 Tax=Amycolatopsis solani TaxID=3028615 RepID=UPI0025AFF3FA|nr:zinc-binding dehydrogenase [Amycolatopsis sp. MEP2-6]